MASQSPACPELAPSPLVSPPWASSAGDVKMMGWDAVPIAVSVPSTMICCCAGTLMITPAPRVSSEPELMVR